MTLIELSCTSCGMPAEHDPDASLFARAGIPTLCPVCREWGRVRNARLAREQRPARRWWIRSGR